MALATGLSLMRSPKAKRLSEFCGSGHRPKIHMELSSYSWAKFLSEVIPRKKEKVPLERKI